jgi:hypothetical protein
VWLLVTISYSRRFRKDSGTLDDTLLTLASVRGHDRVPLVLVHTLINMYRQIFIWFRQFERMYLYVMHYQMLKVHHDKKEGRLLDTVLIKPKANLQWQLNVVHLVMLV